MVGNLTGQFNNSDNDVEEFNRLLITSDWDNLKLEDFYSFEDIQLILSAEQAELLQRLIQLIPEWERLMGCKQHKTHDYCLDLHTFLVLKKIKKDKRYLRLGDRDKLILLYAALLHDIAKSENQVDYDHPLKGANIARDVLTRLGFDWDFSSDVHALICNHQVLGFLAIGKITIKDLDRTFFYNKVEMIDLLEILSDADIKSVKRGEYFYSDQIEQSIRESSRLLRMSLIRS